MSMHNLTDALKQSIIAFKESILSQIQIPDGKLVQSFTISPTTGELTVLYSDNTSDNLGKVRAEDGEPGAPGVSIIDVQLFEDPLEGNQLFLQTTLSNGIILRTLSPLDGYAGASVAAASIENNQLLFTLDDGTELAPIPVAGLQAISVVGAEITDGELFFNLSNGQQIAAGVAGDLKGRDVVNADIFEGKLRLYYSDAPSTAVDVGDVVGIEQIRVHQGALKITLSNDPENEITLTTLGSITGAKIVGNELVLETNQPAPNDEIVVGPVADLKGDPGVGIQSVDIADNNVYITLTDDTELPPIPASGLNPISVVGARFDVGENELYLQLSNSTEISTGIGEDFKGAGITGASLDTDGKLYITFENDPGTPVHVGDVPGIQEVYAEEGRLMIRYTTDPTNPVDVGPALSIASLTEENGRLIATYTDGSTDDVGSTRSIAAVAIVAGVLRVTYNDGFIETVGNVIGPPGVSIIAAEVNAGGDLILERDQGQSSINAGHVRTTVSNFIGQIAKFEAEEDQTTFEFQHDGKVLAFLNGELKLDTELNLSITEEVTFLTPLTEGDKVALIAFSEAGTSITGRGVQEIEDVGDGIFRVTLEDASTFDIDTNTPPNIEDLPPGISSIQVLPNGNLEITLTNNDVIDAGPTSNAINTVNAYIDGQGDLHIVLSDSQDINVGTVVANLSVESATINAQGELVLVFSDETTFNAGVVGNYVVGAEIDSEGRLQIELSDETVIDAGAVVNPMIGMIYDFVCFEGQFEFAVPHDGYQVLFYANGVSLSPASLNLTDPLKVAVNTPRDDQDIVRIVLVSQGTVMAAGIAGEQDAPNASAYGKDANGNLGFHALGLVKVGRPYDRVATVGQQVFSDVWNGGEVEVIVDGQYLMDNQYSVPNSSTVTLATPLNGGEQVRIIALTQPKGMGDFINTNYARVAFQTFSQGGTFNAGAWRIRQLNTIVQDAIGLNLNTNRIILPTGTYYIRAWAACNGVRANATRLFNQTTNQVALMGVSTYAEQNVTANSVRQNTLTPLEGYFTLTTQSALVIQHRCLYSRSTRGFGAVGGGVSGANETQASLGVPATLVDAQIWKVG